MHQEVLAVVNTKDCRTELLQNNSGIHSWRNRYNGHAFDVQGQMNTSGGGLFSVARPFKRLWRRASANALQSHIYHHFHHGKANNLDANTAMPSPTT